MKPAKMWLNAAQRVSRCGSLGLDGLVRDRLRDRSYGCRGLLIPTLAVAERNRDKEVPQSVVLPFGSSLLALQGLTADMLNIFWGKS
jgi:hypothetical protein